MPEFRPNDIVLTLKGELEAYVAAQKGQLSVANDPFEVIELLGESPTGFRVIILWEGDEDATGQPLAGIVNNTIAVIVSHNRGLRMWKGENLHKDYGDQPALLTRLADLRAQIRAYEWPEDLTDSHLLYLGTQPETTPEGLPLDAYRMRFRLTTVIPV